MLIDTHCHLNFKVFRSRVPEVLERAAGAGVEQVVVVGSQLKNSKRAALQAAEHEAIFAAVGVHPHHVWDYLEKAQSQAKIAHESLETIQASILDELTTELTQLVAQPKVVAVGEVGLDYHGYEQTQYQDKQLSDNYKAWQADFFIAQAKVAADAGKALIIHNREAIDDLLPLIDKHAYLFGEQRVVLHCCEPEQRLLDLALARKFFIGVDGDVTFDQAKQDFIQAVPLELLVLETDAPYITPEPDKSYFAEHKAELSYKDRVCEPRHVAVIADQVARLKNCTIAEVETSTTRNAQALFQVL